VSDSFCDPDGDECDKCSGEVIDPVGRSFDEVEGSPDTGYGVADEDMTYGVDHSVSDSEMVPLSTAERPMPPMEGL
jgi:hypothetical protein